jgi:hypothetical protein
MCRTLVVLLYQVVLDGQMDDGSQLMAGLMRLIPEIMIPVAAAASAELTVLIHELTICCPHALLLSRIMAMYL